MKLMKAQASHYFEAVCMHEAEIVVLLSENMTPSSFLRIDAEAAEITGNVAMTPQMIPNLILKKKKK